LLWPLAREEERARKREEQAREGREEGIGTGLYPLGRDNSGGGHLLARIDSVGCARQLLAAGGGRREE
jgi:hypothetical protein